MTVLFLRGSRPQLDPLHLPAFSPGLQAQCLALSVHFSLLPCLALFPSVCTSLWDSVLVLCRLSSSLPCPSLAEMRVLQRKQLSYTQGAIDRVKLETDLMKMASRCLVPSSRDKSTCSSDLVGPWSKITGQGPRSLSQKCNLSSH